MREKPEKLSADKERRTASGLRNIITYGYSAAPMQFVPLVRHLSVKPS